jgi:putative ABC transport system permease protein
VQLATAEIRQTKVRFALLIGAIGLLGFLILLQEALLGALLTSFRGALENQDAEVVVFADSADRNLESSVLLDAQLEEIAAVEGVERVGIIGEDTVTALVPGSEDGADGETTDVTLWGYLPDGPGVPTTLVGGRLPEGPGEALASADSAADGFDIGEVVTVVGAGAPGELKVVGLADDVRYAVAPTLLVTFDTYTEIKTALNPNAIAVPASIATVELADGADADTVAEAITDAVEGTDALPTTVAIEELPGVRSVSSTLTAIVGLAYVVVALVIGFFFAILTAQKRESLTLLHALGAPRSWLIVNAAAQMLLVLLAGMAVAVAFTWLSVWGIRSGGGGLPVQLDAAGTIRTVVVIVVLAAIALIPSALRVRRLDVTEAVQRPSLGGLS